MPEKAPFNYGADKFTEETNYETGQEPLGDIVHDVALPTPPAYEDVKYKVPFGKKTLVRILNRETNKYERLPGTHWGDGVVLLDRDDEIIAPLLDAIFEG